MKILLPTDGSQYSNRAVEYLCDRVLLKKNTDTVYLLNVQKKIPVKIESKIKSGLLEEVYDEASKAVLKPAKKRLEEAGYKVKVKVAYGKATTNIVKYANEIQARLIVMGSHGHTPVRGLLFGSKTSSVLASCSYPLLVIRDKFKFPPGDPQVGICVDGSPYSVATVDYVQKHLQLFGENPCFHLINVVTPHSGILMPQVSSFGAPAMTKEEFEGEQREPFDETIEPLYEQLRAHDIQTKVAPLTGEPAEEIAKYAKEHNLVLLILGTHGRSNFTSAMLGSTAMRIGTLCGLPMLLVHNIEEEEKKKGKKDKEKVKDKDKADKKEEVPATSEQALAEQPTEGVKLSKKEKKAQEKALKKEEKEKAKKEKKEKNKEESVPQETIEAAEAEENPQLAGTDQSSEESLPSQETAPESSLNEDQGKADNKPQS